MEGQTRGPFESRDGRIGPRSHFWIAVAIQRVRAVVAQIGLAFSLILSATMMSSVAMARPERAPPVDVVARVLGVGPNPGAKLDAHGHEVARAAGHRLVSLCPDCRLSTIDEEGPCGWARAQRGIIRNAVAAGMDEEAIVAAYVRSYGKEILAIDKNRGFAAASWVVPIVVVLASFVLVMLIGRRLTGSALAAEGSPPSAAGPSHEPKISNDTAAILKAELDALD